MSVSEVLTLLNHVLAVEGDIKMFCGDMEPLNAGHFDVVGAETDNPDEQALYGKRYLHLGKW